MNVTDVFRHMDGFGGAPVRMPTTLHHAKRQVASPGSDPADNESSPQRIAHTLTACCRCRQRKTRCDPALPRCLPCERSGSVCEYFDTTKGKKVNRYYVVKLQNRVRQLEAELGQYTDDDDLPKSNEDIVRAGGLVRLNEADETPRYLGPSSGIAMTRILMEEAKRYTDTKRISELIPEIRVRRLGSGGDHQHGPRSQSFSMPPPSSRKKSYPVISAVAAQNLPSKPIAEKLLDVFNQRAQVFTPILHEKALAETFDAVYGGSTDSYHNFIVRMVMAISLQKLDTTYAGLADSYYLAAMQHFEEIIKPKDLKTLQCLVLIGQYSLLVPTRTAVYYIIGLATRICQQLGLADEKTITAGYDRGLLDPLTLDMRRRVGWIVMTMEFGLAQSMGRPDGFAKSEDVADIQLFSPLDDEHITEEGISQTAQPSDKKLVAIHFCKMRMFQAEIRRILYERKRSDPKHDNHPWFGELEQKMEKWLNESPNSPAWCKPWFTGRYHTMIVTMYRPTPQIPRPSSKGARRCYESSEYVIQLSSQQMMKGAVDITWVFLLTLYMALNALLWSVSYSEVRASHPREDAEELVNIALDIIDQCTERWPGTAAASQLYSIFAKACLQSYDRGDTPTQGSSSTFNTPPSIVDTNSPPTSDASSVQFSNQNSQGPVFNPPQFGYVFDSGPEAMNTFAFDDPAYPTQPTFRSNSIFMNPASVDPHGRRFSYFPPDFTHANDQLMMEETTPPGTESTASPPLRSPPQHIASPSESHFSTTPSNHTVSPPPIQTPNMQRNSPIPLPLHETPVSQTIPRTAPPAFTIPPLPAHHHQAPPQRPLPQTTTVTDWFNPPPPFISPYAFAGIGGGFWGDNQVNNGYAPITPLTQFQNGLPPERQGSLNQQQQIELMDVLENEGLDDINQFLNMGGVESGNQVFAWNGNS